MSMQIVSDLVANVAQVAVTVGQHVHVGKEVALLESMKMEIPVLDGERPHHEHADAGG